MKYDVVVVGAGPAGSTAAKFLSEKGLKINFKESFAYADSFVDLPILELVGKPVAVSPDEELKELAQSKGWQVI